MSAGAQQHVSPFTVKIGDAKLAPELAAQLLEIKVRQSLRQPSSALIRIGDPDGHHVDDFKVGGKLEVLVGAISDQSGGQTVFKGEIVALEPEFDANGVTIGVRAYDQTHRLQHGKKVRTFQQSSASDMVNQVLSEAGLSASTDSTSVVFEFFQQSDETDREFIRRLERMHDYELYDDGSQVHFRAASKVGSPTVTLTYRDNLLSFRPRLSTAQQDSDVEVRGWDIKGKKVTTGTASSAQSKPATIGADRATVARAYGKKLLVSDRSAATSDEANLLAKSTLERTAAAFVEAEGSCLGEPKVKAGETIEIKGIGTQFSGKYVVTGVTHQMRSPGTFKTFFTISGRSDRGLLDLVHPPQERPWGQSMVVGIVTNNNDPEAMGRVRVKYPSLSDKEEGAWARVLTHNAGKARGIYMLPQNDDEVVVAFENGDSRRPLVIGSVFNGSAKPQSEMLPDQNGGFAVMSDDCAYVHTKKDMTFKSDQKMIIEVTQDQESKVQGAVKNEGSKTVEMKAGTSYTLEAGSSMSIKGASITVEAKGTLSLKGATVEIESQGPASLKGATVQVNAQGMLDLNASGVANLKGTMVNIG
jgi:phage protein D/phage baseplate assembly protein gpV